MKKLVLFIAIACCIASCGNKKAGEESVKNQAQDNIPVYKIDSLLAVAGDLVDKEVKVCGEVTHVCKHSGRRCFIVGKNPDVTIRVEAGKGIGGFNKELVGSELEIKGIVKERRLTREEIDENEKEFGQESAKEDGSAEKCRAEIDNIKKMRDWMAVNNKDYYPIYFLTGEDYEVIDEQ